MKILILGHGRHGKDTVAELLRDYWGLTFESSSMAACNTFIFEQLRFLFGYRTRIECYNDRHNHRAIWHRLIADYNIVDKTKLAKLILSRNDIYVGMRCIHELNEAKKNNLFDHIVWVDASYRLPPESKDSMTITQVDAGTIINNNGPERDLLKEVAIWVKSNIVEGIQWQKETN